MILDKLTSLLSSDDCQLVGCIRQNRLLDPRVGWRQTRGNAILGHLAYKVRAYSPVGDFDIFLKDNLIFVFRGGKWKEWWDKDIRLLLAVTKLYTVPQLKGCVVIQELDGELSEHYIPSPTSEELEKLVQQAVDSWRSEGRIPKNSPQAFAWCPHCLVKAQCDAKDLEDGHITDWPTGYKPG